MELDDVAFRYRRRGPWVLQEVSMSVQQGRIVEVTGPNGAGKSTLLRVLAGLLRPGRGAVSGRPPVVGYAPERFPAAQPFTARGYLRHLAGMRRVTEDAIERWAARLEYAALLDEPLAELSKGTAQKVGLTQALLAAPGLLVLDEPFAGLDAATRAALPGLLAECAAGGAAVVVSDHQRALRDLPGVDRLRMAGGRLQGARRAPDELAVIEVFVARHEVPAALARLRADGYRAAER